jgi:hypothetical protein
MDVYKAQQTQKRKIPTRKMQKDDTTQNGAF